MPNLRTFPARPVPNPPVAPAPRARGLVVLFDSRTEMVEGPSVTDLYAQADALGGYLVEVAGGAADWSAERGSSAA